MIRLKNWLLPRVYVPFLSFFLLISTCLLSFKVFGQINPVVSQPEMQWVFGYAGAQTMGGCCKSSSPQLGSNIDIRFPEMIGSLDVAFQGATTGKLSEFSTGPSFYVFGRNLELDPSSGDNIRITRVPTWSLLSNFGVGFLIHSTRTTDFDLPTLVVGLLFNVRMHLKYAWDERWSIVLTSAVGIGFAFDYYTVPYFVGIGPGYRF